MPGIKGIQGQLAEQEAPRVLLSLSRPGSHDMGAGDDFTSERETVGCFSVKKALKTQRIIIGLLCVSLRINSQHKVPKTKQTKHSLENLNRPASVTGPNPDSELGTKEDAMKGL